ncbi:MAG: reactive intermediate/imine deaminase [Myxococcales bacterium]|nr:reactive intermediate/imine deaminase [Myxococcales bacterium]
MQRTAIATPQAPAAIGPYSQAIRIGAMVFTSGQIPLDPATGQMLTGDIAAETRLVLDNLGAVLAAAGAGFADVVKSTIFLTDLADFAAVNEIYAQRFTGAPPARSTVQVARLPKDARVEIELVAFVGGAA